MKGTRAFIRAVIESRFRYQFIQFLLGSCRRVCTC